MHKFKTHTWHAVIWIRTICKVTQGAVEFSVGNVSIVDVVTAV